MGKLEITEKLDSLLSDYLPFTEESHVVYLLVEIRKILDRENNSKYPLLQFYRDWCVHTAKDKITPEMKSIMEEIYSDIFTQITSSEEIGKKQTKVIDFMHMEDLRTEMQAFLKEYKIQDEWILKEDNWISLVSMLVGVLADQPINKPCAGIEQFSFVPAPAGNVKGEVIFTNKIDEYTKYEFGKAYY